MPGAGEAVFGVSLIAMALIVASFPIIKLMGWIAEGAVETPVALLGILLYLALIVGVMGGPSTVKILLVIVLVISAVLTPVFGQVSDQMQHKHMDDEQISAYARALEQNPMNHSARMGLAEALRKRGDLDQAIEHMAWTLQQAPGLGFRIRPQLDTWKRERERIGIPQPIFCHQCRAENQAGAMVCESCGAQFGVRAGMKEGVWRDGGPKVVLRAWIVTSLVIIFALFVFYMLPLPVAGVVTIAAASVGAWLFLRWVGGDMGVTEG